ncbi:hypothetical protein [Microbacterium oleivorans]|uniref:Uncharacterized protein n=1 Tax=Microbacterium oleivorans TaxID=273677 RepID=A0A031FT50_9MICO|nr:hypothetical protein [Microbacterium oleivorans]AZS42677.1 hypothetical protein BWL13_00212 [Microbacterium oleivorans]EZP27482.1 hypothetical protein BW34_01469 [Microbacterium oleivorans]THE08613.1 hypothetical protein E1I21_01915 [Microbacterium oleivorans]
MTPARDDSARSAGSDGVIELFVGQVLALFPLRVKGGPTSGLPPPALRRIFPRSRDPGHSPRSGADPARVRARTYTVVADAPGHGFLTLGDYQVEVVILPLDVSTPPQATVFRIASISGRVIKVTGAVIDPLMDAAG